MKKIFISLLIILSNYLHSQTIQGSIFDEYKKPIMGVSVYLDGTTIETSTDENGKYVLNLSSKINTSLVIRLMGYETVHITDPFKNKNLKIYLVPKEFQLNEVVIKNELFNRKQKLIVFREQFLGTSKAGKSCTISNEDNIDFDYDYDKNILYASSSEPLKIKNNYLGYEIEFDLQDFYLQFLTKSIKSADVIKSFFLGSTFYREIEKGEKINKKRENAYDGSKMNFFKNLSENNWGKDKFLLYKNSKQADPELYFTITDEANLKKIVLINDQSNKVLSPNKVDYRQIFNLIYKKVNQSQVFFLTDTFYVDEYGNNSNPGSIEFNGEIGQNRLGDMLPMSYSKELKN
jgi:hypothetical protein